MSVPDSITRSRESCTWRPGAAAQSRGCIDGSIDELADLIEPPAGGLWRCSQLERCRSGSDYLRVRLGSRLDSGDLGPLLVQRRGVGRAGGATFHERAPKRPGGNGRPVAGLDVPGNSLVLVTIDRIPFPRPDDPVMSARQAAVDAEGRSGFREVALTRAALLLAQGAGRLIRSESDRGVVAVSIRAWPRRDRGALRASCHRCGSPRTGRSSARPWSGSEMTSLSVLRGSLSESVEGR